MEPLTVLYCYNEYLFTIISELRVSLMIVIYLYRWFQRFLTYFQPKYSYRAILKQTLIERYMDRVEENTASSRNFYLIAWKKCNTTILIWARSANPHLSTFACFFRQNLLNAIVIKLKQLGACYFSSYKNWQKHVYITYSFLKIKN